MRNTFFQHSLSMLWYWLRKIPWILGNHAFLVIIIMVALEVFLSQLLFYRYVFLARQLGSENAPVITFKEQVYDSVLVHMEKRQDALEIFRQREYDNPFQ